MNRGDVVEVDWPFSDLTGTKPRPAIVVQADFLNGLIDDTIYVKIQRTPYGIPGLTVSRSRTHISGKRFGGERETVGDGICILWG